MTSYRSVGVRSCTGSSPVFIGRLSLAAKAVAGALEIQDELRRLANPGDDDARPTPAFQRVVQRAVTHVQWSGRNEVTGANVLVAMFAETESPAARLLGEQHMTFQDAVNFMSAASSRI